MVAICRSEIIRDKTYVIIVYKTLPGVPTSIEPDNFPTDKSFFIFSINYPDGLIIKCKLTIKIAVSMLYSVYIYQIYPEKLFLP